MLGFKNNQNVQPLYDYYVETDLDSFDDQPVDYSKKYSDQDTYDDCRRTKSTLKADQFPSEVSQTIKQSYNDEVKVYCIEGTPLTISYASSLSDLREVGTSSTLEKADLRHNFPSINDNDTPESFDIEKKDVELHDVKSESSLLKDKDDVKEGKSVSFRNSTDISKASSPLMFSRSSSIGSLNSFEQQSIVDDRSSVSVFSALTSGLISPSDLPDSPGEIMSPTLTDKDSSPKIDVTKEESENECDNIDVEEKSTTHLEDTHDNQTSALLQLTKTKVCNPMDSDRNSEDNEILAEQLEISNDSLDVDEVFDNPNYENDSFTMRNEDDLRKQFSKSDDESDGDDILLQQCIQLGMPSNQKGNCEIVCKQLEYSPHSQNISSFQVEMNKEDVSQSNDLEPDETKSAIAQNRKKEVPKHPFSKISRSSSALEIKADDALKCDDDDSDDDDDELLQRCIQLGMPEDNRIVPNTEGFVKTICSSHLVSYNSEKELHSEICTKSADDSDRDDISLQQCTQQGMPRKLSENIVSSHMYEMRSLTAPLNISSSQVELKSESRSHQLYHSNRCHVMPPQSSMQYRMPQKLNEKITEDTKPIDPRLHSPVKKISKNVPKTMYSIKTDVDSDDDDENDPLLQHCIEMGMPKETEKKHVFRKPEFDSSLFVFHPANNTRDNCPDGTSDGDEDDILEKCIRAGMPSPKSNEIQNRIQPTQIGSTCRKRQISNRAFMPETNAESNKRFNHFKLPHNVPYAPVHTSTTWISTTSFIDVDSMRIYRTEDTPIISPSASISDLSSLSFNESFLNNSRNSDCSSESDDDDELLQQCIRSGMPEAKRAVA